MSAFVGGEFWTDPRFETERVTIPTGGMTFLNGGEAAMRLTCAYLHSIGIHELLVPAYICSTMADAFNRYGMGYTFYRLGRDFRIDLDNLLEKVEHFKALYLVNYFGYGFADKEVEVFRRLKSKGMQLVEDDAQAGFNRASVEDIRFNSLRKMVPHDGSFFYSGVDLSTQLEQFSDLPNRRLPVMREFRRTFASLIAEEAETFEELNPLFEQSEKYYYEDLTVLGNEEERQAAERMDWDAIEAIRKANHVRLIERLAGLAGIEVIFPQVSPDCMPLGFPIYVKDGKRDELLHHLREHAIYPVVHWPMQEDPRLNRDAEVVEMSKDIMTLILDQRFDLGDMDYEAEMVRNFFK